MHGGSAAAKGAEIIPWNRYAQFGPYYEAEALASHAFLQAQAGFGAAAKRTFKKALSATEKLEGFHWKDKLFASIAVLQARAGFFKEAVQTAKKVADLNQCAEALKAIASLEEETGNKLNHEPWVPSPP
ncbi:MAG: hypothetical protein AB1657_00575 [Candidatus Micrarchaeota archaeon]